MKKYFRFFTILYVLSHGMTALYADDSVSFINFSMRDGLVNASVSAMVQDKAGFIWVGTQGGLHRWDGQSFTLYESEPFNRTTLPHNSVQTLYLDTDGETIWIGSYGGLTRFETRTGKFTTWSHEPDKPASLCNDVVVAISRDAEGRLWVGTLNGLDRMEGNSFIHYAADSDKKGALSTAPIRSIYCDSKNNLWIGSSGGGLYRYRAESDSFEELRHNPRDANSLPSDFVFSIAEDSENRLWLGLWNFGLACFNPDTKTFIRYPLDDTRVYFINAQIKNCVWVGTWGGGLFEVSTDTGTVRRFRSNMDKEWSLPNDTLYSMLLDTGGNIWVGTNGGGFSRVIRAEMSLSSYEYRPSAAGSKSSGKTSAILKDSKGRLWVAAYNNGIDRRDPGMSSFTHYKHAASDPSSIPDDIVSKIYEDSSGTIWVLTNNGMASYNEQKNNFIRVPYDKNDPNSIADFILCNMIEEPGTGNFWIATYSKGLEYWDRRANVFIHYPPNQFDKTSVCDNLVYALVYDYEERLWVGTNGGLCRYEGNGIFKRYSASISDTTKLPSKMIRDLYVDSFGVLWIATNGGGVACYDERTDSFRHWTKRDGLESNSVYKILEGGKGSVWAATANGLSIYDNATNRFRPFFGQTKMRNREFTAAAFKDEAGMLYFGALNALHIIDPSVILFEPHPPRVRIISIRTHNSDLHNNRTPWFTSAVDLNWDDANIDIGFAALDYGNTARIQFAYMLEGFDKTWMYSGSRAYASYTNLQGGRSYTFKVKVANSRGAWSDVATELTIHVSVSPWSSWWAIVLYIIAGFGFVWIVIIVKSRSMLRAQIEELHRVKYALENANAALENMAIHDSLTGLFNRRALDEELVKKFAAASRYGKPIAALMIDIDLFKNYNDHYGHQSGDGCLSAVARAIAKSIARPEDFAGRYGGEEFVVLLPDTDENGAANVAEKVRAAVEDLAMAHEVSDVAAVVTVSVGYAVMRPDASDESGKLLVDMADEALYRAKNAGRNRISM